VVVVVDPKGDTLAPSVGYMVRKTLIEQGYAPIRRIQPRVDALAERLGYSDEMTARRDMGVNFKYAMIRAGIHPVPTFSQDVIDVVKTAHQFTLRVLFRQVICAEIRARLNAALDARCARRVVPGGRPPRYDEVYFEGVEWLDSL
jgi:hypothetical protein